MLHLSRVGRLIFVFGVTELEKKMNRALLESATYLKACRKGERNL